MDHTLTVEHEDVLRAHTAADQQLHAGNGGRTGAQTYHLCLFNFLALQLKSIDHAGRSYDSGTVLVIVEDGHVTLFNQRTLNLEALRCFDVFEVDTTEGIGDTLNSFNKRLRAFGINLDVEDVNSGKALEQYALAFHNRLARQRAEITQTQDSGTVRNHGNQVTLGCVFVSVLGVLRDLADRFGNPGAVRQGEVAGSLGRLRDFNTQLTRPRFGVIFKGCFFQILRHCHCSVCHV